VLDAGVRRRSPRKTLPAVYADANTLG
jgi:hypothetical protein